MLLETMVGNVFQEFNTTINLMLRYGTIYCFGTQPFPKASNQMQEIICLTVKKLHFIIRGMGVTSAWSDLSHIFVSQFMIGQFGPSVCLSQMQRGCLHVPLNANVKIFPLVSTF